MLEVNFQATLQRLCRIVGTSFVLSSCADSRFEDCFWNIEIDDCGEIFTALLKLLQQHIILVRIPRIAIEYGAVELIIVSDTLVERREQHLSRQFVWNELSGIDVFAHFIGER